MLRDFEVLYDCRLQKIYRTPFTKIKSNNPANCDHYIEYILQQYELEGLQTDFETLKEFCNSQWQVVSVRNEIEYLIEELAQKTFQICKRVDKEMSKFFYESTPWSPNLQNYHNGINYWHRVFCTKINVFTSKYMIKRLQVNMLATTLRPTSH